MANPAPVIGEWYRRTGGDSFEVVAIDPDDRTIEIQYFDGTIEEIDLDEWLEDHDRGHRAARGLDRLGRRRARGHRERIRGRARRRGQRGATRCSSSIAARSSGYSEVELSEAQDDADRY